MNIPKREQWLRDRQSIQDHGKKQISAYLRNLRTALVKKLTWAFEPEESDDRPTVLLPPLATTTVTITGNTYTVYNPTTNWQTWTMVATEWRMSPKKSFHKCYDGMSKLYVEHTMSLLSPINDQATKTFRVPIFKKQDVFVVWTGQGAVRYFDPSKPLPDCIKSKLGLIMASPFAAELNQKEMSNTDFEQANVQSEVYISKFGKDYEDIGWQYNKYYYCVVLSGDELEELQG
jgi:hypothetical protein